jgi:hypothetical protein
VARQDDGGGEPCEGIGYTFGICGPCPYAIASIVALIRANIPAFNGMRGLRATSAWFLMFDHFCSWQGQWSAIEIERAVDVSLSG